VNALEAGRAAAREIRVHKVRSLLSFAAISVGAASLLYTLAQTRGMKQTVERNFALMGKGPLDVTASDHYQSKGLSAGLTYADARAIRDAFPHLTMVSPRASTWRRFVYRGKVVDGANVSGVTPDWRLSEWVYRLRGRFLDERDERETARVCVVVEPGGWVKKPFWASFWDYTSDFERLVSRDDLLGRYVRLADHDFLVVGVLKDPPKDKDPRWRTWGGPDILVPLTTYIAYLRRSSDDGAASDSVTDIQIDTGDPATMETSRRRLTALLSVRHHGEKDFRIRDEREDLEGWLRDQNKDVAIALTLGLVALLSGGIGILNVTLAAVFSRVKEIGIRRALGAGRADVMALFVFEAGLLGLAGGVAGAGLGVVAVNTLAKGADQTVADITWVHIAAMVALSAAVAAVFAAYPAWLGSRLDPVEALKEEA
jgi:putative ABC transport system permease protein